MDLCPGKSYSKTSGTEPRYNHLWKKKLIYCKQFCFHAKHSTDHAVLTKHYWFDTTCNWLPWTFLWSFFFFGFSKAFDTVNHNTLIEKIDYYGFRGVAKDWFTSCLTKRYQFVSLGHTVSKLDSDFLWCCSRLSFQGLFWRLL